jgi:exopolysaccharide biosynthesis WecB/TagA/CpsF family protein
VAFFEAADLIQVDSVPLIFWAQIVGRPGRRFHRNTYLDWRDDFWRLALTKGWKVFFLGGKPGMALNAKATIERDWPGAQLGVHHGYFDQNPGSAENEAVLKAINDFAPDILFVGLGMPLQERWIHQNLTRLPACAAFPVGGAFDYEADVQSAAPRWIGQIGMEWMYRLMHDPQRLFFRYCIEPWRLMPLALKDLSTAIKTRYRALSLPRRPSQDDVFAKVRTQLPPVAAQALAAKAARRATDLEDTSLTARLVSLLGLAALVLMWTACLVPCAIWLMTNLALRKTGSADTSSADQALSQNRQAQS